MAIAAGIPEHLKKKKVEPETGLKRKGWRTPYGFGDFTVPVTYEEACAEMEGIYQRFQERIAKEKQGK